MVHHRLVIAEEETINGPHRRPLLHVIHQEEEAESLMVVAAHSVEGDASPIPL